MKRIIIFIVSLLLTCGFVFRVHAVNSKKNYPVLQEYQSNENVPLESDFFFSDNENMNGYSVKVIDTEVLTHDEFMERYHVEEDKEEAFKDANHMVLVTTEFNNLSNMQGDSAGINLQYLIIQSGSFINYIDREALPYVNDFNVLSFCLSPQTKKQIIIPFRIYKGHISIERFYHNHPQLVVSLYPHKKSIELYT